MGKVEDELHFMLGCPLYQDIRAALMQNMGMHASSVTVNNENMQRITNGRNASEWNFIATYIREGYKLRAVALQLNSSQDFHIMGS